MTRTLAYRILAAVLALTGTAALVFWLTLDARLPSDEDYRAVNEAVKAELQEGDAFVLSPSWATRGRDFLRAAEVFTLEDFQNGELVGVKRAWLVALAEVPGAELEKARQTLGTPSAPPRAFGPLMLQPFPLEGPELLWRLAEVVHEGEVRLGGKKPQPCPWRRDRFQCPKGEWNSVHDAWFEVEETPMRCVWAHPVDGAPLEITVKGVPSGSRLKGRAAFIARSGESSGAPVSLEVRQAGVSLGSHTFSNRPGRQPFELSYEGVEADATLTFSVSTPNSGRRHFCFDVWVEAD